MCGCCSRVVAVLGLFDVPRVADGFEARGQSGLLEQVVTITDELAVVAAEVGGIDRDVDPHVEVVVTDSLGCDQSPTPDAATRITIFPDPAAPASDQDHASWARPRATQRPSVRCADLPEVIPGNAHVTTGLVLVALAGRDHMGRALDRHRRDRIIGGAWRRRCHADSVAAEAAVQVLRSPRTWRP